MTRQTYTMVSLLLVAAVAWASVAVAQAPADPYAAVPQYRFDQPRAPLAAIEAQIRVAKPQELAAIETRLMAILESPATTQDAKDWVCRQLRQAGSERSIAALTPLLADKDLATVARLALESIPGEKVDAALRQALAGLQGDQKVGVILSLGNRHDRKAVELLAPLAGDANAAVAEAALFALGNIGGADALRAVEAARVPDALKRYRFHAMLRCAESLAAAGQAAQATAVYQTVYQQAGDSVLRTGALRGLVLTDKAKAAPLLAAALKGNDRRLREAAAKFTCELAGAEVLSTVLAGLDQLPAESQVLLFGLVNDKAALPAVLAAAKGGTPEVRQVALDALGRIGDASNIAFLLQVATAEKGEAQAAARKSLQDLRGADVDVALAAAAQTGKPAPRVEAIRALAARGAGSAVGMLLKAADDADRTVQAEAFNALGVLADAKSLSALVKLLVDAKTEGRRGAVEKAVTAVCRRIDNKDAAAEPILAAIAGQNAETRCALLRVLSRAPSARSLAALRAAAGDADPTVKDAAIRGLAGWPDAAALPDLAAIARSAPSQVHKVLALRGFIRLASQPKVRPAAETVKLLGQALERAKRTEEKRAVLAALAEAPHAAGLSLAASCLTDKDLEVEAATAMVRIAKQVQRTDADAAAAAIQKVMETAKSPAARQVAESAQLVLNNMVNIAPQGTATSPDGLKKDGGAGDDQAAIDGDPNTYWDKQDNQKLYRFAVTFKQPERIAAISVLGYTQHSYAPKDFEIVCDGKVAKKVVGAQYDNNFLVIRLDEVTCKSVELRITGYYGNSPAIRELGIYRARK